VVVVINAVALHLKKALGGSNIFTDNMLHYNVILHVLCFPTLSTLMFRENNSNIFK